MLCQLKRGRFMQTNLVTVYVGDVIPDLENAFPVWHTNLPEYVSDNIEITQKRAALIRIFLDWATLIYLHMLTWIR
ncbi:hypothetical protein NP493_1729g00021 [Ridgeia piscesae]|uniref:Uncharacterized protein n=1 Tax=Ridgeia piscesae TaxID=27915 RepID=A0AAD9JU33_RIDPI|nr:hypothetical protein NP493_1729g00021 [Ridgeia piscesae]